MRIEKNAEQHNTHTTYGRSAHQAWRISRDGRLLGSHNASICRRAPPTPRIPSKYRHFRRCRRGHTSKIVFSPRNRRGQAGWQEIRPRQRLRLATFRLINGCCWIGLACSRPRHPRTLAVGGRFYGEFRSGRILGEHITMHFCRFAPPRARKIILRKLGQRQAPTSQIWEGDAVRWSTVRLGCEWRNGVVPRCSVTSQIDQFRMRDSNRFRPTGIYRRAKRNFAITV